MNINDNKLNELMDKTENLIWQKIKRRRLIRVGSLAAFLIVLAIGAFSFYLNFGQIRDVVIGADDTTLAAGDNTPDETSMPTPTPLSDGTTWDPNAGPTPEAFSRTMFDYWSDTKKIGNSQITVNVQFESIGLPALSTAYNTCPIIVAEPKAIDSTLAQKAASYFLGDIYYSSWQTKDDCDIWIEETNKAADSSDLSDSDKQIMQEYIEWCNELKEESPAENVDSQSELENFNENGSLNLKAYNNEDAISYLNIFNDYVFENGTELRYDRGDVDRSYIELNTYSSDEINARGMKLSFNEASQLASEAVNEFAPYMRARKFALGNASPRGAIWVSNEEIKNDTTTNQCYIFYYSPIIEHTAVLNDRNVIGVNEENEEVMLSTNPIYTESIRVMVDDDGIVSFDWNNATIYNDSIEQGDLIGIDKAMEIFKHEIFSEQMWNTEKEIDVEITINEMELGLTITKTEDGNYLMIPAYAFKGYSNLSLINSITGGVQIPNTFVNIMLINAIDGSIIE